MRDLLLLLVFRIFNNTALWDWKLKHVCKSCKLKKIMIYKPKDVIPYIRDIIIGYDAVSDLMHNWVERPDFKSALRVVKIVLNTQYYLYPCLTMWFHAKHSKETLNKSKSPILLYKFGSRPHKSAKIPWKKLRSIAICSIFYMYGIS